MSLRLLSAAPAAKHALCSHFDELALLVYTLVSYNTIWRIEDGRQGAHPRTIRKLAEALGVEPSELVRGSEGG